MNIIFKFHFLNGITEINQLFDDTLIIWPAVYYKNGQTFCWTLFCIWFELNGQVLFLFFTSL